MCIRDSFLVVLYAVFSMCDNLKGIFIPIYKEEFLLSDTQAGAISTSAMLALAIFQYLSSLIVGRLGYKRLLVISFIVVGGAIILVVFSTSYLTPVSYTHLDVYKRQPSARRKPPPFSPAA